MLLLSGCVLDAITHAGKGEPTITPTVRFAVYNADLGYYQDISDGHPAVAHLVDGIKSAPEGPMKVACDGVQEVGVMFHYDSGPSIPHDFNYVLYKGGYEESAPEHFIYEILRHGKQLRGAARFKGSPGDGVVTFAVTHRDHFVLSTEFDLIGCK